MGFLIFRNNVFEMKANFEPRLDTTFFLKKDFIRSFLSLLSFLLGSGGGMFAFISSETDLLFSAKGIKRPLFAIYRRVLRMYDRRNYIGKYSPEEVKQLKSLKEKHGNDWATIGIAMGRSASSVKDRYRLLKENCQSGTLLHLNTMHEYGEPFQCHGISRAVCQYRKCFPLVRKPSL